jgi:3-oxoacyl-[acyl-carrier protein] reductase
MALDVTDAAACEALVGEVEKRFGAVGILVNNAGITRDNLAMRMKDEEWDAVIDTNLRASSA